MVYTQSRLLSQLPRCAQTKPAFFSILIALLATLLLANPAAGQQSESVSFVKAEAGLTGVYRSSSSIADVDGDGNKDLLIAGNTNDGSINETATLYLGNGQGDFTEANAGLNGAGYGSTSIADVNGDGNKDLLITGYDATETPTTTLYLGNGQGSFEEADAGLTGVVGSSSIADVNGDGNKDLLITGENANITGTATLYLGDGKGGFKEADAGLTGVQFSSSSIADIDGDGNKDLLITGYDVTGYDGTRTTTIYLGDGKGEFEKTDTNLTGVTFGSTSIADVDGDGNKDLLITGNYSGSVSFPRFDGHLEKAYTL